MRSEVKPTWADVQTTKVLPDGPCALRLLATVGVQALAGAANFCSLLPSWAFNLQIVTSLMRFATDRQVSLAACQYFSISLRNDEARPLVIAQYLLGANHLMEVGDQVASTLKRAVVVVYPRQRAELFHFVVVQVNMGGK